MHLRDDDGVRLENVRELREHRHSPRGRAREEERDDERQDANELRHELHGIGVVESTNISGAE